MAWVAPVISGAAGILGNLLNQQGQNSANAQNAAEAQRNRDFQAQMSNTAHQREVRDLKAAGINPVLTATGGSGASTPSGNMATAVNAKSSWSNLGSQVNSAAMLKAQIDNVNADTLNKNEDTKVKAASKPQFQDVADSDLSDLQLKLRNDAKASAYQAGLNSSNIDNIKAATANLQASLPGIEATSKSSASSAAIADQVNKVKLQTAIIARELSNSELPEAKATAKLFEAIGSLGTGQVSGALKFALQSALTLFGGKNRPNIPNPTFDQRLSQ